MQTSNSALLVVGSSVVCSCSAEPIEMASSGRFSARRFLVSCFRVDWFAFRHLRGYHHFRTDGTATLDLFVGVASALLGKDQKPVLSLSVPPRVVFFPLASTSSRVLSVGYPRLAAAASFVACCCWIH